MERATIAYLEQRYTALEKEIADALRQSPTDDLAIADLKYRKLNIADEIEHRLKKDFGVTAHSVEGRRRGDWILLDYVDFVAHVFLAERRAFYDIERLRKSARPLTPTEFDAELKGALAAKTRAARGKTEKVAEKKDAAAKPRKINLRTPDVMARVQEQVESHYRSLVVERLRANGGILTVRDTTLRLAKQFGFCYGVERAIDLAYAARKVFQGRRLFIFGEIIHNPLVNEQIAAMGIKNLTGVNKRPFFIYSHQQ